MSLTYTSPEALQKAQSARRNAALSTLLLTILACGGILVWLGFMLIKALKDPTPVITPLALPVQETPLVEQEIITEPQPDPASSSASAPAPQVLMVSTPNNVSMAKSEIQSSVIGFSATDGIDGLGFGNGFGTGTGQGMGFEGIFNSGPVTGERFAFIVDFSGSNSLAQRKAIQTELTKVIEKLKGVQYQVIGFAGPAWFLGDEIQYNGQNNPVVIESATGRNYRLEWDHVEKFHWRPNPSTSNQGIPRGNWISASAKNKTLRVLDDILEKKNWIGGTNYTVGLETALQMNPKPDVIYFLTDGRHNPGNNLTAKEVAEQYGERIKREGIQLISIGLVTNESVAGLKDLTMTARGQLFQAQTDGTGKLVQDYAKMSSREIEEQGKKKRRKK